MFFEVNAEAECRKYFGEPHKLAEKLTSRFAKKMLVSYVRKGGKPAVQVQIDETKKWFRIPLEELTDASNLQERFLQRVTNCMENQLWENPGDRMKRDPYHKLITTPERFNLLQHLKKPSGRIIFHG